MRLTMGYGDSQTYYGVEEEGLSCGQCQGLRERLGAVNINPFKQAQIKKQKQKIRGFLEKI